MSDTEKTVEQALEDLISALESSPEYLELKKLEAGMAEDADFRTLEDEERQAQEQLAEDVNTPNERAALVRLARAREALATHPLKVRVRELERSLENQLKPLAQALDDLPGKRLFALFGQLKGGER